MFCKSESHFSRLGEARPRPKSYDYSPSVYVAHNLDTFAIKSVALVKCTLDWLFYTQFGHLCNQKCCICWMNTRQVNESSKGPDLLGSSEASRLVGRYNAKSDEANALLENYRYPMRKHSIPLFYKEQWKISSTRCSLKSHQKFVMFVGD